MAFPAAIFIRKYSYKAGVLLGLGMYAFGAFLFFPAKMTGEYYPFLIAIFHLTCGLSSSRQAVTRIFFLWATEETATRRLNLAQSFNPWGSLLRNVCSHAIHSSEATSDVYRRPCIA